MCANATSKKFQDPIVWRKAHQLVLEVYRLSSAFPRKEMFALSQQMRRAAVSIPANIAEGFARRGMMDTSRFMNIAEGLLEETRYYLTLSQDLGYGLAENLSNSLAEIGR